MSKQAQATTETESRRRKDFQLKKILVPVDFSERAAAAAKHGAAMAKHFDSELIFLHAVAPTYYQQAPFNVSNDWAGAPLEDQIKAAMADLVEKTAQGRDVETFVLRGDPAETIEDLAEQHNVDLVIMPTHGYGRFRRFLLGSVTAKVLHDVNCPVFTGVHVPDVAAFSPGNYKRVACAVDLKRGSEDILRWAKNFAEAWDADLTVIHAAPEPAVSGAGDQEKWKQTLIGAAEQELKKLLQRVGCEAEIYVDSADVVRYVPAIEQQRENDLLVIGRSKDEGPLGRLRTQAYALIRESLCPVIGV